MSSRDPDEMRLIVESNPPADVLGKVLLALYDIPMYKTEVVYDPDSESLVIVVRSG